MFALARRHLTYVSAVMLMLPVGDPADWTDDPFSAVERDGWLFGRGTEDMKSGVACWMAATARS